MATAGVRHQLDAGDVAHEVALHERLVAYVDSLSGEHVQTGVWGEHSYARVRGGAAHVRVLLAARVPAPAPAHTLDVLGEEERPAPPDTPPPPPSPPGDDGDDDDRWEERVAALAPGAAHARLAGAAAEALRGLRLARLAGAHRPERAAARRLRLALAGALAERGGGAHALGWVHGALCAHMPGAVRRLYDAATAELCRAAPRLASRVLGAAASEAAGAAAEAGAGRACVEDGPCVVWLCDGSGLSARCVRALRRAVCVRVVRVRASVCAPPDAWCAQLASATRAALEDAVHHAGAERCVVVGGAGACASLCACACSCVRGVRGALLVSPPLVTAEGPRAGPGDALADLRIPLLVVVGGGAQAAARDLARRLVAAGPRRLLEVRGADHALRVSGPRRARLRLTQRALDAAVAERCARWLTDLPPSPDAPSPAPHDDYAHLAPLLDRTSGADSVSEACEGRVVSRGCGATPLALLPPRRAPAAPVAPAPAPALAPADIMRLPIVFADDEQVRPASPDEGALTVTSGRGGAAWPYTRVIVASRGAGGGGAAGGGGRPVVVRRTVRVVPRH